MTWRIGVSTAWTRRGWIAVVQSAPPASATPAAALPFRNVLRLNSIPAPDGGSWRGMDPPRHAVAARLCADPSPGGVRSGLRLDENSAMSDVDENPERLDPREEARARRRDRDAEAQAKDLMRPGMGKVFKQIQDAQAKAANEPVKRRRGRRS